MMWDYLNHDATPASAKSISQELGDDLALKEARIFKAQIERHYPPPRGARVKVASNAHDFGYYYDIHLCYNLEIEEANEWAFQVEADPLGVLQDWDEEARDALTKVLNDSSSTIVLSKNATVIENNTSNS